MALTNYEQTADDSAGDKNGKTGAGRGSGKPAGAGGVGAGLITGAIFKAIIVSIGRSQAIKYSGGQIGQKLWICFEGKLMTPCRVNTIFVYSFQQLNSFQSQNMELRTSAL